MFEEKRLLFFYCLSPVHVGTGQAIGVVDNPIQRERHTAHPMFAGSGIKGALRDQFAAANGEEVTSQIFGPPAGAPDHAGAVAFGDAQVVLFPVRSLRESYVYATSPTALARLKRAAELVGLPVDWAVPEVKNDELCVALPNCGLTIKASRNNSTVDTVVLESFQFTVSLDKNATEQLVKIAAWLKDSVFPKDDGYQFFKDKLGRHVLVLGDTRFDYFVQNATTVEPHVRISDESGTADDGGLFYTENVPPETVFFSVVMASKQRVKRGKGGDGVKSAKEVMSLVEGAIDQKVVQLGGDATVGRGLVALRMVG